MISLRQYLTSLLIGMLCIKTTSAGFKFGRCSQPQVAQNFDVNSYLGTWYEISRDEYTLFEVFAKCVTARYTKKYDNDDGSVKVRNDSYYRIIGWIQAEGKAVLVDPDSGEGNFVIGFGGNTTTTPEGDANYQVIDTDYDTYTVVYSGTPVGRWGCVEVVWVLSRTPELSDDAFSKAKAAIKAQLPKYDYEGLAVMTKQGDDCPYDEQPE